MNTHLRSIFRAWTLICFAFHISCAVTSAAVETDFLIDSTPYFEVPKPVANFNPAMKSLWIEALQRPEADMQRMAAETIARAHQLGISGLTDAVPALEKILAAESSHPAARFAAARALIALDSRSSSEILFKASSTAGADLRQLIEPALAQWHYNAATPIWIKRLETPTTRYRDLVLAMRSLATVREPSVLPQLRSIASDLMRGSDLRLDAAAAAGQVAETGLEQDADRLAHNTRTPLFVNQICAIRFLARHSSESAKQLLTELASHPSPVVAAAALKRLNEIDNELVAPLAESAIKNPDQNVREQGIAAYLKLPTPERIALLGQELADTDPSLRHEVCEGLYQLADNPELAQPIRDAAMQTLSKEDWQGQVEAALLLGELDYKPAADRLVELLNSPRKEVLVTAAWALRKIAVPETAPAMIDQARRQTERRKTEEPAGLDDQIVHLFEALGQLKATEATPLLLQYVPKNQVMGDRSRSAAIWALGQIMEGKRDSQLEDALGDRISDYLGIKPEKDLVREMSAITLAKMKAVDEAATMKRIVTSSNLAPRLGSALRWAVKELTGEELPPPDPFQPRQQNWFLEALQ